MSRILVSSGAPWEREVGYSRAVRVADRVFVAGTVGIDAEGRPAGAGAYEQARQALAIIQAALAEAGARLSDVVRTRMYIVDPADADAVGRAHGEVFADIRPASTLVVVKALIDPALLVEIEAEALISRGERAPLMIDRTDRE